MYNYISLIEYLLINAAPCCCIPLWTKKYLKTTADFEGFFSHWWSSHLKSWTPVLTKSLKMIVTPKARLWWKVTSLIQKFLREWTRQHECRTTPLFLAERSLKWIQQILINENCQHSETAKCSSAFRMYASVCFFETKERQLYLARV
jgi:hypothetical protein